jgi:MbtH protein
MAAFRTAEKSLRSLECCEADGHTYEGREIAERMMLTGNGVNDEDIDTRTYQVVRNDEEQYSIWPADRDLPAGWQSEGTTGTKDECLTRISAVWTDMRPRSLRLEMDRTASESGGVT